jgi:squalene synthase HpnC
MTGPADLASGKGHTDENFPVAGIVRPQHRAPILAFYRFVRAADDVADHATAAPEEKLRLLEVMRATLVGESDENPQGVALRAILAERGLDPQHALDLLEAFRRDCTKTRYADWADLMDYCRYSAAPVGRYVLDVHGEDRATWPANDALCSALQVINHLQDCGKDYREIDRVYVPVDALAAAGLGVEALGEAKASPALRGVIRELADRTLGLLKVSAPFARMIDDTRLAYEVAAIQHLAESLTRILLVRDPLSEKVHHSKPQMLGLALLAATGLAMRRR